MQRKQRFVADQRWDLPHYDSMSKYIDQEFNAYNKAFFSAQNKIVKNWTIESAGGLIARVNRSIDSMLFNSERVGKEGINYRQSTDDIVSVTLADNATNYVEVQIFSDTCATDTVAIWDTTANAGAGEEFTQSVDTADEENVQLVSNTIAFSGATDHLPLAIVVTSGGSIVSITDARNMLFSLSSAWNFGVTRTDKTIGTLKEAFDAITSSILEHKGTTHWFDQPWSSSKTIREYQNIFYTGGGTFEFEGSQAANTLAWNGTLSIEVAGRSSPYTLAPGTVVLLDGQCAYIAPGSASGGAVTLTVSAISAVPTNPLTGGFDPGIIVLFLRRNGIVYGTMDLKELSSGETGVLGSDLSLTLRARLGIVTDTTYAAYGSNRYILDSDNYAQAIGKLDQSLSTYFNQLRLTQDVAPNNFVLISAADQTALDSTIMSQELSSLLMSFAGAKINFTTGAITALDGTTPLGINFTPVMPSGTNYRWFSVSLVASAVNSDNTISAQVIVLPGSADGASGALAPKPAFGGTKKLGMVLVQGNGSGGIANISQTAIRQLGTGSGGAGGVGDTTDLLERVKEQLDNSIYGVCDQNLFLLDTTTKVASATAAFDVANSYYKFSAAGQQVFSLQHLDTDFLAQAKDMGQIDLVAYWKMAGVDTAATYEASRDGGVNWQTITMNRQGNGSTDTFQGTLYFVSEATYSTLNQYAVSNANTTLVLDITTNQTRAQAISVASGASQMVNQVSIYLNSTGSPLGNFVVRIVKDVAGLPSTSLLDVLVQSQNVSIPSIGTGNVQVDVTMPQTVLGTGTYHVQIVPDATYAGSYSAGVNQIALRANNAAVGQGVCSTYNGTIWSSVASTSATYFLKGRPLDLRIRITSSAGSSGSPMILAGYGVMYDVIPGVQTGMKNIEVQQAVGASNTTNFTLTKFRPDADLLKVYIVETGATYVYPAFALDGMTVKFPTDTFNDPLQTYTLKFDQNLGGAFDNSDKNAALMSANSLGSTDASIDKSIAGHGIFLRRPDGTLREIALDNNDNIVVYSV